MRPCEHIGYCYSNPGLRYFNTFYSWEPDYWTLNIAWPFLPGFGPDTQLTRDYYGRWYVAGGIYTGLPGPSLFGGYLLDKGRATPEQLEGFITEDSFSMGGGAFLGGGVTWGHIAVGDDGVTWDDFALEGGVTSPGGIGSWTYGVRWEDFSNKVVKTYNSINNFFSP